MRKLNFTRADPGRWLWMSGAAGLLAAGGSVFGLIDVNGVYGRETPSFVDQAIAQDAVNLAVVCPAILILALLAARGSLGAYLAWLGALSFTIYNYVIYCLSVHVGPLFLVWVAVLGLSVYAMAGGLLALDPHRVAVRVGGGPRRTAGWFLVVVASLFALLWLSQIVPAIAAGRVPSGASELGLPASPVHVLDLALYLPATFVAGVGLLRSRPAGPLAAPILLVFLAATSLPIMATPFVAAAHGHAAGWVLLAPMGVVTLVSVILTIGLARAVSSPFSPADRALFERQLPPSSPDRSPDPAPRDSGLTASTGPVRRP